MLAEKKSYIPELKKGPERELKFSSNANHDKATPFLSTKSNIRGRLLTPEEGCGYSKVENKRIVGGSPAKIGNLFTFILCTANIDTNFKSKFRGLAMDGIVGVRKWI